VSDPDFDRVVAKLPPRLMLGRDEPPKLRPEVAAACLRAVDRIIAREGIVLPEGGKNAFVPPGDEDETDARGPL
jgi:hypothetical protein